MRAPLSPAIAACLAASVALASEPTVRACDCALPPPPHEAFAQAAAVFEARILWKGKSPDPNAPLAQLGMVVLRSWKGAKTETDVSLFNALWCAAPLEVGGTYILYAERGELE